MRKYLEDHLTLLRRYALVLTRSREQAEDLVQEALVRALAGEHSWQTGRDPRPWLLSIVHNTHVSRRRRRAIETAMAEELKAGAVDTVQPNQPEQLEFKRTISALMRLPEAQRTALVLIAIEGMSYREAADVLGVPVGTLMSRLARGREALRAACEGSTENSAPGSGSTESAPVLKVVR